MSFSGILSRCPILTVPSISFKRRQKAHRYSIFGSSSPRQSTTHLAPPDSSYMTPSNQSSASLDSPAHLLDDSFRDSSANGDGWAIEGPGRRIYDDLTAIDWIFEYTKERLRVRALEGRGGVVGHLAKAWDASHIWLVLIGTGIMAGVLAAFINIVTNWLGDLKDGYCSHTFYLSRNFCCWGLDGLSETVHFGRGPGALTLVSWREMPTMGLVEPGRASIGFERRFIHCGIFLLHFVFGLHPPAMTAMAC